MSTRPADRSRRRRRIGLAVRLALEAMLVSAAVMAAATWLATRELRRVLEAALAQRMERLDTRAEAETNRLRREVQSALVRVRAALAADSLAMERLLLGTGDLSQTVAALMYGQSLDRLEIFSEDDRVLASGMGLARVGVSEAEPWVPSDGSSGPEIVADPLAVAGREVLEYGSHRLPLAGAKLLDPDFVERVAGGEIALLVPTSPAATLLSSPDSAGLAEKAATWAARPGPGREPVIRDENAGGRRLALALAHPLDGADGKPVAQLVLLVDPRDSDELLHRTILWLAALGAGVTLVAGLAGALLARRMGRLSDDLLRAFDAISADEADYAFAVRSGDELLELRARFSEMKRALDRALANQRIAAWGEVQRHLAHEVKNALAPIRLSVENLLKARRGAPERFERLFRERMPMILDEVQQLTRTVVEFEVFRELPMPVARPVNVAQLIEREVELYAAEPEVRVTGAVDRDLPLVEIDSDQVSRALKNVIKNAIEASRERPGGAAGERRVDVTARVVARQLEIEVADTGPGFSAESARRVFEPYFTTKTDGTGLGMALTYRIIVEHGGTIAVENRAEGGARVVMRLPLRTADRGRESGPKEVPL